MGGGECFNCAGSAADRYTLVLPHGKVLKEKYLCDECAAAFREEEWMEVHEGSVLMRGESGEDDDET